MRSLSFTAQPVPSWPSVVDVHIPHEQFSADRMRASRHSGERHAITTAECLSQASLSQAFRASSAERPTSCAPQGGHVAVGAPSQSQTVALPIKQDLRKGRRMASAFLATDCPDLPWLVETYAATPSPVNPFEIVLPDWLLVPLTGSLNVQLPEVTE